MSVRRFVLASQSPRRRQILTISGYDFDILPSQISEIPDENLNLTSQIRQLASDKAEACLKMGKFAEGQGILVLASDTVVAFGDQILGKPKDEKEARSFLRRLSGQTHDVITAVSLRDVDTGRAVDDHAVSKVKFRDLSEDQIESYIASGDPFDKAGGYGIQSVLARNFVEKFDGEYDTIVGLPMKTVEAALKTLAVSPQKRSKPLAENFKAVRSAIDRAYQRSQRVSVMGNGASAVGLVAVTKTKPVEDVLDAVQFGQRVFGENYAQEALEKIGELNSLLDLAESLSQGKKGSWPSRSEIQWHFIGSLQSKKIKSIVGHFSLLHSVDRVSLVEEIEKRAAEKNLIQSCLLQINIGEEATKGGVSSQNFGELLTAAQACPHIRLSGVMALPPLSEDESVSRRLFQEVRAIFEKARTSLPVERQVEFCEISMGTTSDFQLAIEEGATLVRIGTALFGARE